MSRVLVTGGTGAIGRAVVRRLLADPAYDVRVADRKEAPQWMREGCEIRDVDLSDVAEAASAMSGCAYVIHLASPAAMASGDDAHERHASDGHANGGHASGGDPSASHANGGDHSLIEASIALDSALVRVAIDQRVARFVYVSCAVTVEHADEHAASRNDEADPPDGPAPRSAHGFAKLVGERLCRAAHAEHGLPVAICRPPGAGGPDVSANADPPTRGTQSSAPADEMAAAIVAAMSSPAA